MLRTRSGVRAPHHCGRPRRAPPGEGPGLQGGQESWEDDILAGFLETCLRARGGTVSPFRDYLEAPESVIALYQRFGGRLNELAGPGTRAWFDYLLHELTVATAAALWHLPEDAAVTIDLSAVLPSTVVDDIDPDFD